MVFFFAGCAAVFYLLNIPICAAISISSGQPVTLALGVGIFTSPRIVRKTYTLNVERLFRRKKSNISIDAGKYALRHLLKLKIDGKISIGTGDAKQTAELCGLVSAIHGIISQIVPGSIRLAVEPDFNHTHFYASIASMAQIKIGHIMCTLLLHRLKTGRVLRVI